MQFKTNKNTTIPKKFCEIAENNTKNLEKKPNKGGIPANENKSIENVNPKLGFKIPKKLIECKKRLG